ncbi:pecanex-like protein 2 isoform X2 [Rhineura floridana]|uniref:pecanex-like protein 2 isoform X2 n=1 Tax=Rhineura floridana TaxID=261503 RepID=UPI002AC81D26|nr:pecanex-like protein 2 isoform X2 [Rhineura floridana]
MVSQAVQLLRQGVWAALTGGWYHDPEQSKFTNSCHLYLWLFFLLLPMALHLAFPPNTITAVVYCISVTVFFTIIKVISYRMHLMFDKGEVIQQKVSWKEGKQNKEAKRDNAVQHINLSNNVGDSWAAEEIKCNGSSPTIHSSVKVQAILSHHSSGVLELPAQETIEDLKGVMVLEDQPAPPVSSTSSCAKADILSASMTLMSSSPTSAIVAKPNAMETFISTATSEKEEKVEPSDHSGVEDMPLDKDGCTTEKNEGSPETEKNSVHGSSKQDKPEIQTQDSGSINPMVPEPTKFTAHYQSTTQRQIIYRLTSQQDSSVLQVISGPEASMQEEMPADAMHVFIDENGEIRSCYVKAGSQKEGNFQNPVSNYNCISHAHETHFSSSSTTTSESQEAFSGDHGPSVLQQQLLLMVARRTLSETQRHLSDDLEDSSCSSAHKRIKQFYKFIVFPGKWIKIWYDRLTLLALLDRTEDIKENVLAILLVILVSFLGFVIMNQGFYKDIWILLFCLIMASCQYSLLKSVQPDPASPIHGHNQMITYSRPVYFCILCGLILLLDAGSKNTSLPIYTVYDLKIFSPGSFQAARDHVIGFLFCFPAISLLGLFPQINTFCIYLLEQIDMLLFGGSAAAGMISSLYSISRSFIIVIVLYAFCFNAVKEPWDAQHIPALFSAFCGLLVALSYHLSRQSSDPSVLMSLIQCKYFPHFLHQHLEDSQTDRLPEKMRESVRETLKSDLIVCSVAAVLSFAVSASTVFLSLGPFLSIVLYALAWTVGFVTHYVLPQLRKHHPWLWISHPILKNKEYQQRELRGAAHLMWFERLYVWLQCFEKYILYPAIILNALTNDAFSISKYKRLTPHCDIFLITIAGMKLLRSSFCNPIHQFVTLSFTVIFFQFDYYGNSDNFLLNFFIMSIVFNKASELFFKTLL